MKYFGYIIILLCFVGCSTEQNNTPVVYDESFKVFTEMTPEETGIDFMNDINETPDRNITFFDYMYNGAGVSIGDINNDGLADIFFTGNDVPNKLYINKGDMKFEDISLTSGLETNKWACGSTMVDINNDGLLDIYVCNSGPYEAESMLMNDLFINNGDLTFTSAAADYGLNDASRSVQAAFFDVDNDGDLDMWLNNHGRIKIGKGIKEWYENMIKLPNEQMTKMSNKFFINEDGKFTDTSRKSKVNFFAFGLGLAVADFNDDGLQDIYCANDYFLPDFYWMNIGKGVFKQINYTHLKHMSYYSMGCDAADFNNDGLLDIATVDMTPKDHFRNKTLMESMDVERFYFMKNKLGFPSQYMFNTFQMGIGGGYLKDVGLQLGVSQTDWSWAPLIADFDNDGFKDYFVTNGYLRDVKDNDQAYRTRQMKDSLGDEFTNVHMFEKLKEVNSHPVKNAVFKNINGEKYQDVKDNWGIKTPTFSNGAAYADLDNDGDLDLVINNLKSVSQILRNNSENKNKYIRIKLVDEVNTSSVLGSKLYCYTKGMQQRVDYNFTRGYQSSVDHIAHFGVGGYSNIDSIRIEWLDGQQTVLTNVKSNQTLVINKEDVEKTDKKDVENIVQFIDLTTKIQSFNAAHVENDFNDFKVEVLLPHKYSELGPSLEVGDLNGDGFQDFYLGGSKGNAGQLFIQNGSEFMKQEIPAFESDAKYEDLGAKFFDYDGDGDQDLYIASGGGGDIAESLALYQDRLYINDGKGFFSKAPKGVIPKITSSTAIIKTIDFNADGKLDLFVGARNKPGKYPLPSKSYFLINQGGKFVNQMDQILEDPAFPGMVTGAEFVDLNGDNKEDLAVVGEWTSPTFYIRNGQTFDVSTVSDLTKYSGWWQSLKAVDLDKDGDLDFIVGNIGENNKFNPDEEHPLGLLANDFDQNGTHDIVMTKKYKDKIVPVRGKECSTEQMPFLAEKFTQYSAFASSSVDEILGAGTASANKFSASYFSSIIIENKGDQNFEVHKLPFNAQSSPIKGIIVDDYNNDGLVDIFVAGNIVNTEPETPAYDAGHGALLLGIGDCLFESDHTIKKLGVLVDKNVVDIQPITLGTKQKGILVANNNDKMQLLLKVEGLN